MKYIITGGAGHISRPLSEKLLQAGHDVTVIGRNASHLQPLTEKGAKAAIGSVEDGNFLKETFAGADAVYTMVPPNFHATNVNDYAGRVGVNYESAARSAKVPYLVNLSSMGAHMAEGCGPVSGLYRVEQSLNKLNETNVLHLRPGYFFSNFLGSIQMIRDMHVLGSNFGGDDLKLFLSDTADIAVEAADLLLKLNFKGHTVKYIPSDERLVNDIARQLGTAIGQPDLPWVKFTDDQVMQGLTAAGIPPEMARNYVEMGTAIQSGQMFADVQANRPEKFGPTKLEDFAKVFAVVYKA
jgi:uncharacterized protein YbjT (DUF2867 family)